MAWAPPALADAWARHLFPAVQRALVPLTQRGPFAWTPPLAAAFVLLAALWSLRADGGAERALRVLLALAVASWSFTLSWGLAYARTPLAERLELPAGPAAPERVAELARDLARRVARDAPDAPPSPAEWGAAVASLGRAAARFAPAAAGGPAPAAPERVRRPPAGLFLTFGYAGMVSPWTLEAHVDAGLPPASAAAVASHELAHAVGWAQEGDADLAGVLAGLGADHPYARYAVALALLARAAPALEPDERETLLTGLPEIARADLAAARAASSRFYRPRLARPLGAAYDRYLRSAGVEGGVGAYGALADAAARARAAGRFPAPPGADEP